MLRKILNCLRGENSKNKVDGRTQKPKEPSKIGIFNVYKVEVICVFLKENIPVSALKLENSSDDVGLKIQLLQETSRSQTKTIGFSRSKLFSDL